MKTITLPLRTINALNAREHWRKRARRAKKERLLAYCATPAGLSLPLTVNLKRLAPRLMDDDGLTASFKAIRDGIADKVQVNDGNPELAFRYSQEKSKSYAIEIVISARAMG